MREWGGVGSEDQDMGKKTRFKYGGQRLHLWKRSEVTKEDLGLARQGEEHPQEMDQRA